VKPVRTLIATDIFGITPELVRLAGRLCSDPLLISAHEDPELSFASEAQAYKSFLAGGGVEAYARRLQQRLEADPSIASLVGFSAGASAGWIAAAAPVALGLSQAVLFYGSRIREQVALRPLCPVRLIFAEEEASFIPAGLVHDLTASGVRAELVPGSRHGFMNELSAGFSLRLQRRFIAELAQVLSPSGD
jgi:dienelactone hydrolase